MGAQRSYFSRAGTLLEIGCGAGFVLSGMHQEFPERTLIGSDLFVEGLAFAGEWLAGVRLFQMDARPIPFENEFDVVGAFDVLEHIEDDEAAIRQMCQAKPGGGILLAISPHRFLWSVVDDYAFHGRRYTRKEFVGKVARAGFEIIRVTSFVSLLLPMMLLDRAKRRSAPLILWQNVGFIRSRIRPSERDCGLSAPLSRAGSLFPSADRYRAALDAFTGKVVGHVAERPGIIAKRKRVQI